jgi:DNA ligase (NAD+)
MGEVSARKAIDNLRAVSTIPLARFVAGFDIFGIAELKVQKLVDAGFDTLEKLRAATVEEMAAADGIARITAEQIAEGMAETSALMDALLAVGAVSIAPPSGTPAPGDSARALEGLTFCFTGALEGMTRSEAERLVRDHGGEARSSVSGALSYLVTNEPHGGSSKTRKAGSLGVPIIDEATFLEMVARGSSSP